MLKRGSLYSFRILVDSLSSWVAGAINPATPRTSKSYMGVSENRGPPNICTLIVGSLQTKVALIFGNSTCQRPKPASALLTLKPTYFILPA